MSFCFGIFDGEGETMIYLGFFLLVFIALGGESRYSLDEYERDIARDLR
jgi:hypothetical protein